MLHSLVLEQSGEDVTSDTSSNISRGHLTFHLLLSDKEWQQHTD